MLFVTQVIAVICVLVWCINIPRFGDPVHGNWVSAVFCTAFISHRGTFKGSCICKSCASAAQV